MADRVRLRRLTTAALCVALSGAPVLTTAQTAGSAGTTGSGAGTNAGGQSAGGGDAQGAPITNLSLDRIRLAINREPVLDLTDEQVRFYSLVTAKAFDVERVLGGSTYDLLYGPTKGGAAMTHSEFLKMVTPEELYSSAGIKAEEMLQWSLVNIVGHAILRKLLTELKNARNEREAQQIRDRIERELDAIKRAGGGT